MHGKDKENMALSPWYYVRICDENGEKYRVIDNRTPVCMCSHVF
jgi:hypothetical protein